MEIQEQQIQVFCDNCGLKSLIRQSTCYKSPSNPTYIGLILTSAPQQFMRKIFKKLKLRTINYRSYKHFSNEAYRESLLHELSKEVCINNDDDLQRFCDININILNRHAPRKRKNARGN